MIRIGQVRFYPEIQSHIRRDLSVVPLAVRGRKQSQTKQANGPELFMSHRKLLLTLVGAVHGSSPARGFREIQVLVGPFLDFPGFDILDPTVGVEV